MSSSLEPGPSDSAVAAVVPSTPSASDQLVNQTDQTTQQSDGGQPQQQQPADRFALIKSLLIRCAIIYFVSSFFRRQPVPQQPAPGQSTDLSSTRGSGPCANIFHPDAVMDIYFYVTESQKHTSFLEKNLIWKLDGYTYGDWYQGENADSTFSSALTFPASETVQNNGTLYLHVYVVLVGRSPNPRDKLQYEHERTIYRSRQLNKYKRRYFVNTVNLLTGKTDADPNLIKKGNESEYEIISHWHENLTLNLVVDHTPWTNGSLPQPLDEYISFIPNSNFYHPIVYFNDYWNLNSQYQPINDTVKSLNLSLTFYPLSLIRWQMYAAQGMRNKWFAVLQQGEETQSDEEQDSLKRTLLETSPYLLALTIVVSLVHSVFEFLAFKNDIQFWRNRKSLEGLSVRSVFFNVFQSVVVVLYVLDNETNFVVRVSVFIGLLIEIWKIHKVIDVKLNREVKYFGFLPKITFEDKSTYTESKTKAYDMMAFKYLSWALFPLLAAYAVYSLVYNEHKGWYSFILNMLYGFLLTFGFIMMTPQLFINYKLKSVAHLPWRMLTYKALNTFIDDIFAFVIHMPTLYRIGCFRDDVVFFIFLYQRYIYRVDPSRVNEFGTSQEMMEGANEGAEGQDGAQTPSPAAVEGLEISPSEGVEETKDNQRSAAAAAVNSYPASSKEDDENIELNGDMVQHKDSSKTGTESSPSDAAANSKIASSLATSSDNKQRSNVRKRKAKLKE